MRLLRLPALRRRAPGRDASAERGQILVLAILALAVLLAASALAVDYGRWLVTKRSFQNQADAAVLAGAGYIAGGSTSEQQTARQAAWASLKEQLGLSLDPAALAATSTSAGSPYLEAGYRVWVASPASDAGAKYPERLGGARTVFALIERDDRAFLASPLGGQTATIAAWATAGRDAYRFALEVLCPMGDARCPGNARDLKIAGGTQGSIRVLDGDVGSAWGLNITSSAAPGLIVQSGDVYLMDTTPGSGWNPPPWTTGGMNRGATPLGPNILPLQLGAVPPVPDWPAPAWIDQTAGSGCVATGCAPLRASYVCGANGKGAIPCGPIQNPNSSAVTCGPGAPRLAPGTYDSIDVRSGCLILDPSPPGYTTCVQNAATPVPVNVGLCRGQTPGIFHVRSSLTVGSGNTPAFLIADGVTLVFDAKATIAAGNSGAIVLNDGNAGDAAVGAATTGWTSHGDSPWPACSLPGTSVPGECVPDASYGSTGANGKAEAFYVRPAGIASLANGCGNTIGSLTMNGSFGLLLRGAFFAPCTDLSLGASPYQGNAGAVIAWTITYNGQTELQVEAIGSADLSPPYLLEPTLGE